MKGIRDFYFKRETFCIFAVTALYLIFSIMYPLFNHPLKHTFYFGIFIDELIQLMPVWIIFYQIWFLYLPGIGLKLIFSEKKLYLKWIIAMNLGIASCFMIYSIFQTTVPRPEVINTDIFSLMVKRIYTKDLPYNCFPSIHVTTTYITMTAVKKMKGLSRKVLIGLLIIGWLINFSTLFVKQHVFFDLVSGVLLALVAYRVAEYFVERLYNSLPIKTEF